MNSSSSTIHRDKSGASFEVGRMTFNGRTFEARGFAVWPDKAGRWHGVFYVHAECFDAPSRRYQVELGTWDRSRVVIAQAGPLYLSNMGDRRRRVRFTWDGRRFSGVYYASAGDLVRAREVKRATV